MKTPTSRGDSLNYDNEYIMDLLNPKEMEILAELFGFIVGWS